MPDEENELLRQAVLLRRLAQYVAVVQDLEAIADPVIDRADIVDRILDGALEIARHDLRDGDDAIGGRHNYFFEQKPARVHLPVVHLRNRVVLDVVHHHDFLELARDGHGQKGIEEHVDTVLPRDLGDDHLVPIPARGEA